MIGVDRNNRGRVGGPDGGVRDVLCFGWMDKGSESGKLRANHLSEALSNGRARWGHRNSYQMLIVGTTRQAEQRDCSGEKSGEAEPLPDHGSLLDRADGRMRPRWGRANVAKRGAKINSHRGVSPGPLRRQRRR